MVATTSNPSWRRRAAACWGPSTPGATRLSTKLQRSLAKYTTTAARVPKCSSTSKASSGVRKPSSFGTIDRWADDEIGRNSVSPWTMPRTRVRSTADRSHFHAGRAFQADVVIGDQRHVDVADLELACERRLRIAGHVDDLPAGVLVPAGLGAGREPRPLHDHHGAAVVRGDPKALRLLQREPAQLGTVGVGEGHVRGDRTVIEGVGPPRGPVDELVTD